MFRVCFIGDVYGKFHCLGYVSLCLFKVPFVCGCRNLGEALRRIAEGAALIRTKGEAGSGNIVEAVRHMRTVMNDIAKLKSMSKEQQQ